MPTRDGENVSRARAPLVLVVDDCRDSREWLVEELVFLGCRVLAAENGLEGLRIARTTHPDLIVLDISMPIMDGCEMAQHVRNHERTCGIPILAVTCFGSAWQSAARACGCDAVLERPGGMDRFDEMVQSLLARAAPTTRG